MGYHDNPAMVRVDFFKESGKWYTTESVEWLDYSNPDIFLAFAKSLARHLWDGKRVRLEGMQAVVLEPYHEHAFPLMMQVDRVLTIISKGDAQLASQYVEKQ